MSKLKEAQDFLDQKVAEVLEFMPVEIRCFDKYNPINTTGDWCYFTLSTMRCITCDELYFKVGCILERFNRIIRDHTIGQPFILAWLVKPIVKTEEVIHLKNGPIKILNAMFRFGIKVKGSDDAVKS